MSGGGFGKPGSGGKAPVNIKAELPTFWNKKPIKPTPTPTKGRVIREVPHVEASLGVILPLTIVAVIVFFALIVGR